MRVQALCVLEAMVSLACPPLPAPLLGHDCARSGWETLFCHHSLAAALQAGRRVGAFPPCMA